MSSAAGLTMPGEVSPHLRTLMAWPDQASLDTRIMLKGAEADIAAVANAIVKFEPVTLFCKPKNFTRAQALIRDTGPVYVRNAEGDIVGVDFNFNYWGNKYKGKVDTKVARSILEKDGVERVQAPLVAEGGAIEVDGEGTLLVTESSIVNNNRNPGQAKETLEQHLKAVLGVRKVIWVKGLKDHDITDWHIDAMARFISDGKVLLSRPPNSAGETALEVYADTKKILETETDAKGWEIQVLELEEADPHLFKGEDSYQLVLSYLSYLLVSGGVIIPAFGDQNADGNALKVFQQLFPLRRVQQVSLSTLRILGGGIHCATQQHPRP